MLQLGGETVFEDKAKTRDSKRRVWLDARTAQLLGEHKAVQDAERMLAGDAWQDNDLVFCRSDGRPWPPDLVSRRFKTAAKAAGVPVIKLHEGRHSAASLAHEAMVDPEIRQRNLGHSNAAMTSHYTHPEAAAHRAAAEAVAKLVEGDG